MVGKVLGNRYRVLREIGSGGMAWVYLAEDIKDDRLVAVKVLYPQFGEDLSYIHRFNREAKMASAMTDPHIVRVLDYGADRDVYYLIMEYIEGQDLRKVLEEKGPFPWRSALDVLDQLATALEHAHIHGIVHRDVKPQNMMLDDTGMLKVLDFGIARISTLPSLTQSGFIGSPYYVSPEQAMSEEVDIRSDIYSSGIVLYELLSGHIPFDAKSPWSIISQHIANEPPSLEISGIDVPSNVQDLLSRMVAKQREDRFQSPISLRQAIAAVLAGQPITDIGLDTRPIKGDHVNMADSLYQRALEAIEAQEWARAADLLKQSLKLNPDDKKAAEKLADTESRALLASRYSTAKRAMGRQSWETSLKNLRAIMEIAPDYKDAKDLLAEANHALEKENVQKATAEHYAEGVSQFEAKQWAAAMAALQEVQRLSPGYKRTEQLLAEAERLSQPTLMQKISQTMGATQSWGVVAIGLLAILVVSFILFGAGNSATGDGNGEEQLKSTYEAALTAIENDNPQEAIRLLDQILERDPDYADAADRKRELVLALTPTPENAPAPVPSESPLSAALVEAQESIDLAQWPAAIDILQEIRAEDADFDQARVSFFLCEAYLGRGLETLETIDRQDMAEQKVVIEALEDFEAGVEECPRRGDLQDQAERASIYLHVLDTPQDEPDRLIQSLTPIVAADPDYADGNAKNLLYEAYFNRGQSRHAEDNIVGALSDYEAALDLLVDDPSEAQTRRAELLLSLQRPPEPPPTPVLRMTPTPTTEPGNEEIEENEEDIESAPPLTETVQIKYDEPALIGPESDAFFAGYLTEAFLEWEPVGTLAEDEYYDVTVMYIFADAPKYWGAATTETRLRLFAREIGVGQAGNDRFYWWVTVRKANTAPAEGELDLPVSPQSEIETFIWTP